MNTQAAKNRDRQYKVILFLVIGLSVISSAVRDLNQLRLAVMEASDVVAELSDTFISSPPALAIPLDTPTPSSCVAMTLPQNDDVRINANKVTVDDIEVPGVAEGVTPETRTVDKLTDSKRYERTNKIKVHTLANTADEAHVADVLAQAVSRTSNSSRALALNSSSTAEFSFLPRTAEWREVVEFASAKGASRVALPLTVNTELDVRKLSNRVTYDFPMGKVTIRDRKIMKRSGATGQQLLLKTLNGTINVRAASY